MTTERKLLAAMMVIVLFYIRYLRTEIEILRFDCAMKRMKESQRR